MNRFLIVIGAFFISCSSNNINFKSTSFIFFNDSLNGIPFKKTSMHIPVKFNNDTTKYYFQFDTGSNKSYLYTGKKSDNRIKNNIKTRTNLKTSIGQIVLYPRESNNSFIRNGKKFIGTLGSDILNKKIIEIDFVNQKINLLNNAYNKALYNLEKMSLSRGRPVITLKVDNKDYPFLYDTGSSLFDLWTDKKLWDKWKKRGADISKFPIKSWSKTNFAYRALITDTILSLKPLNQKINYIWYNSSKGFIKLFKDADVSGIIGNKPFLDRIIILDFKNNLIGYKK